MKFEYRPSNMVCSRYYTFDIEDNTIKSVAILGGCNGNLQGISRLITGQKVEDVIASLKGIRCGSKPTSCPDQIAKALEAYLAQ